MGILPEFRGGLGGHIGDNPGPFIFSLLGPAMDWQAMRRWCRIPTMSTPTLFGYHESPIGLVEIGCNDSAVVLLNFAQSRRYETASNPLLTHALEQVSDYFAGLRRTFELPLSLPGTPFQQKVWRHLLKIPFGETRSYKEIARAIDRPLAVRAVGAANGRNPISIIVPCHRVIGSDGQLAGYGGGLWRKKHLLEHEASIAGLG